MTRKEFEDSFRGGLDSSFVGDPPVERNWAELCEKMVDAQRLRRSQTRSRRTPGFARLAYEEDRLEGEDLGVSIKELKPFDLTAAYSAGIDEGDEATRWIEMRLIQKQAAA